MRNEDQVPKWSRREQAIDTEEFTVIYVANGLNLDANRGEYSRD